MIDEIDFKDGIIVYNDLNIDFKTPLDKQIFSLKEDLLQVHFNEKYIIDVGWHPELDPSGSFKIQVVEDFNWLKPLFVKKCKSLKNLKKFLQEAVIIIEEMRSMH